MIKAKYFIVFVLLGLSFYTSAQKVVYSDHNRDIFRNADFDVVGKFNTNYLVYKNIDSKKYIGILDNRLRIANNVKMDFLPTSIISHDIINYDDFFYFIYQYQKKNIVTCAAAKIGADGKLIGEPTIIDTVKVDSTIKSKLYNIVTSENKQNIAIYKVNIENFSAYTFITFLYNSKLSLIQKFSASIPAQSANNFFSDFSVNNNGTIAFISASGSLEKNSFHNLYLFIKNLQDNSFTAHPLNIGNVSLGDIYLKPDNLNNHFIIASLFANEQGKDIQGIYSSVWDNLKQALTASKEIIFDDDFKNNVKPPTQSNSDLNYLYIQRISALKDGGFVVNAEVVQSVDDARSKNRQFEYGYGSNIQSNTYYQDPGPNLRTYPVLSPYTLSSNNYYAYNIAVLSLDTAANIQWSTIIPKAQFANSAYNFIGYGNYIVNGKLNFLFNESIKNRTLLECVTVTGKGKINANSAIEGVSKAYDFLPKYGKQVSSNEVLIPCQYRSYLCFAKIEF